MPPARCQPFSVAPRLGEKTSQPRSPRAVTEPWGAPFLPAVVSHGATEITEGANAASTLPTGLRGSALGEKTSQPRSPRAVTEPWGAPFLPAVVSHGATEITEGANAAGTLPTGLRGSAPL